MEDLVQDISTSSLTLPSRKWWVCWWRLCAPTFISADWGSRNYKKDGGALPQSISPSTTKLGTANWGIYGISALIWSSKAKQQTNRCTTSLLTSHWNGEKQLYKTKTQEKPERQWENKNKNNNIRATTCWSPGKTWLSWIKIARFLKTNKKWKQAWLTRWISAHHNN